MFDAALAGFVALLNPASMIYMVIGVAFGLWIGFLPGLGGVVVLTLLMPFIGKMTPAEAFSLMWGAHVAVCFGGSISAILFNVPGTSKNVATCFDGFPMTQKGEAARALAASGMASLLGGIFGSIVLILSLPIMRAVMLALSPPEYLMMALWGVSVIALFSADSILRGLMAACLGFLISFIGMDPVSGTARYTFGILQLQDGIEFSAAVIGLFALSQMIDLYVEGGSIVKRKAAGPIGSVSQGIKDCFVHMDLVIRSSVLGVIIGALPGVGGTVGNILAYGQAAQTSKTRDTYGKGNVEGVIAPEAAIAANEGGGLIPTLGFGVPGGEGAAILMSAMIMIGITPGPEMLTKNLDITFMFAWIIVIANILATGTGLLFANQIARVSSLPGTTLIPLVYVVCLVGAYAVEGVFGVIIAVVFGFVGYWMKKYDFSRADMVIGMVMGVMMERYLNISLQLYGGFFWLTRPIALALLVLSIITVVYPFIKKDKKPADPDVMKGVNV